MRIDWTKNDLSSWLAISESSDFSIYNLPFGIFSAPGISRRAGVAIGNKIVDLYAASQVGLLNDVSFDYSVLNQPTLNQFIAQGKLVTNALRDQLAWLFLKETSILRDNPELQNQILINQAEATMHLPVAIPNYTDFYSSIEHATNVGIMFRDPANALLPNWKHLPVGYHGRASSIVVSGTSIRRPKGQTKADDALLPAFGPSKLLDFELEMAFVIGKPSALGDSVSTSDAEDYIFGFALFNDWSARDIQKWEYVPLGPFLAKNFASSLSPWIVTLEALDRFRVQGPIQEPAVLPYLEYAGKKNLDIQLEVSIQPAAGEESVISRSNFKYMYWNMCQQLAHHTVNGCNIEVGDLYASGTISGHDKQSYGSMLELTWQGKNPIQLPDGTERKFLQDYDTVIMRGHALKDGIRVGFGEVSGKILPAT